MTKRLLLIGLCSYILLSSCDTKDAYHQFGDIYNSTWSKNDTLTFVSDTLAVAPNMLYDIQIEIVNNAEFPYQNLWLFVRDNIDNEDKFCQDTIEIKLADIYGKWLGSGFGSYYQNSIVLRKKVSFSQKRNYTFQIIQGMRDEPLLGIEKVGVCVSPSK